LAATGGPFNGASAATRRRGRSLSRYPQRLALSLGGAQRAFTELIPVVPVRIRPSFLVGHQLDGHARLDGGSELTRYILRSRTAIFVLWSASRACASAVQVSAPLRRACLPL